ncbi:sensor histidine kinase [Serratia proteamaculans]
MEKSDLDLKVLFSELFDYFSFLAEEKGMAFKISIPDDLIIHANADLLKRALSNLIINAIDYGQVDGLISIQVHQLEIQKLKYQY